MFTGIVEEMGAVTSLEQTLGGTRLTILASTVLADLKVGDSISINGTCLTVVVKGEQTFVVEASPETLSVTTLGRLTGGAPVNLDLKLNERIGGIGCRCVDGVGDPQLPSESNAPCLSSSAWTSCDTVCWLGAVDGSA
jgi:riboflavin synthase